MTPVRDVLACPVVSVLLGQTEVDEEEFVAVPADAHEEVVGFDVAVDEVLVVHVLDATDHLKKKIVEKQLVKTNTAANAKANYRQTFMEFSEKMVDKRRMHI